MKNIMKFRNVNTTDEEKQIEEQLREAFDRFSQDTSEDHTKEEEKGMQKLTPVEEMSNLIMSQLAISAYESFEEMTDGMDANIVEEVILRMKYSDNSVAVRKLQSMFLVTGNVRAAEELDLIGICADFDDSAYDVFIDELFDTEMFRWFADEYELPYLSVQLA